MSFARTCLSVSQNSSIKALEDTIDDGLDSCLVNTFLETVGVEGGVEGVVDGLLIASHFVDSIHGTRLLVLELHADLILGSVQLSLIQGSESAEHPHIARYRLLPGWLPLKKGSGLLRH